MIRSILFKDCLYIIAPDAQAASAYAHTHCIRWSRCHVICEPCHLLDARGFSFVVLDKADPLTVELASLQGIALASRRSLDDFLKREGLYTAVRSVKPAK